VEIAVFGTQSGRITLRIAELTCNFSNPHSVKIVWHGDFTCKEAQTSHLSWRSAQGDHFDHGLSRHGDDKGLALGGLLNQLRQLYFDFMDINDTHRELQ
jgi:hypothetical protein